MKFFSVLESTFVLLMWILIRVFIHLFEIKNDGKNMRSDFSNAEFGIIFPYSPIHIFTKPYVVVAYEFINYIDWSGLYDNL